MPGHVLVTVGSTKFDQLIRVVDTEAFAAALHERGYDSLLVQVWFSNSWCHMESNNPPHSLSLLAHTSD